ncbi:MAG TPA: NADH:ubiquinone reductase (Na(+)-transporting) subunit D [Myxococcota bacterium]|nr:NADH:ubiquinone reductase (Na(+)-transporting) subunit D [Myxococcota bacterium]
MSEPTLRTLTRPLVDENPITLQILGICSALAITRRLDTALLMGLSVIFVLTLSNASISLLRRQVPRSIRLIVQITVIASLVTVVDQLLQAFAWELSRQLSIFVGLIITNCVVLGRGESFALSHGVRASALDGLGNGLGYAGVLALVGGVRELLGSGSLLGVTILDRVDAGGWYQPAALLLLPPSAFFLLGFLVWGVRALRPEQVEAPEPRPEAAQTAVAGGR